MPQLPRPRRHDARWWCRVPLPLLVLAAGFVAAALWGHYGAGPANYYYKMGPAIPLSGYIDLTWYRSLLLPVSVAVVLVAGLPWLARRVAWRWLPLLFSVACGAWAVALAAVHGVDGLTHTIGSEPEYLSQVDLARSLGVHRMLREYTDHLLYHSSVGYQWHTHASGHPPGTMLTYVLLDRFGLGGVGRAATFDIAVGASSIGAVLITLRRMVDEASARRAAPFVACAPAVLWLATSADAYFLGVTAWGIAALAVAATSVRRRTLALALAGGLLLGWSLYLSYGLTLIGPVALVVALRRCRWAVLVTAMVGVLAVAVAVTAGGFWWFEGLTVTHERYYQGVAIYRPVLYFALSNITVLGLILGPAGVSALCRLGRKVRPLSTLLLPLAALAGVLIADASGLATGEVERIWLPWIPWLLCATAVLPDRARRGWLTAQLVLAIGVVVVYVPNW